VLLGQEGEGRPVDLVLTENLKRKKGGKIKYIKYRAVYFLFKAVPVQYG
jgi:hypothetical protein